MINSDPLGLSGQHPGEISRQVSIAVAVQLSHPAYSVRNVASIKPTYELNVDSQRLNVTRALYVKSNLKYNASLL